MRFIVILIVFAFAGCAKIQYLDEALALKSYSQEKTAQNIYIQDQDKRFDKMLQQARSSDAFNAYRDKAAFVRVFGDPVFCRPAGDLQVCLYRRIVKPVDSAKIYLYFNVKGKLVRWHGDAL